jgi:hypothetical protein
VWTVTNRFIILWLFFPIRHYSLVAWQRNTSPVTKLCKSSLKTTLLWPIHKWSRGNGHGCEVFY